MILLPSYVQILILSLFPGLPTQSASLSSVDMCKSSQDIYFLSFRKKCCRCVGFSFCFFEIYYISVSVKIAEWIEMQEPMERHTKINSRREVRDLLSGERHLYSHLERGWFVGTLADNPTLSLPGHEVAQETWGHPDQVRDSERLRLVSTYLREDFIPIHPWVTQRSRAGLSVPSSSNGPILN